MYLNHELLYVAGASVGVGSGQIPPYIYVYVRLLVPNWSALSEEYMYTKRQNHSIQMPGQTTKKKCRCPHTMVDRDYTGIKYIRRQNSWLNPACTSQD